MDPLPSLSATDALEPVQASSVPRVRKDGLGGRITRAAIGAISAFAAGYSLFLAIQFGAIWMGVPALGLSLLSLRCLFGSKEGAVISFVSRGQTPRRGGGRHPVGGGDGGGGRHPVGGGGGQPRPQPRPRPRPGRDGTLPGHPPRHEPRKEAASDIEK